MSQCGVSIPLSDVVQAIIDNYGQAIVDEVIKNINLADYTKNNNGVASNLTLKDSITVDETVKSNLCSILQDCIADKIQEELGCNSDIHVNKFYVDKTKEHLIIELNSGEMFYISKAELKDWLGASSSGNITNIGGGILSGKVVNSEQDPNTYIEVTNKDNSTVLIDVSSLLSVSSPYIVSGVFVERDSGYWLDFTRNDDSIINVDMTDVINKLIQSLFDRIMNIGYRINTQGNHYTIQESDFDGRTIIRANRNSDQTITITKPPSESFIGKSVIVRKTNGEAGTVVNLNTGDGVSILPVDSTPIRRNGSSVTLVYVGDGIYDVFGELP